MPLDAARIRNGSREGREQRRRCSPWERDRDRQSGVGRSHSALSERALLPHIHIQMTSKVGWNGSCSTSLIIGLIIGLARFLINYSDLLEIAIRASQCGWGGGAGMVSIGSHRDGSYYHSPRAASTGIIASDVRGEDDTNNMEITVRMWMT
jgi:hypothetical protein